MTGAFHNIYHSDLISFLHSFKTKGSSQPFAFATTFELLTILLIQLFSLKPKLNIAINTYVNFIKIITKQILGESNKTNKIVRFISQENEK